MFQPEQTELTISVPIVGDMTFEPDESFVLNLSNVSGARIGNSVGRGIIVDSDSSPPNVTLVLADGPIAENGGTSTVSAQLSAVSGQDVTVNLGFTGTAVNPDDYFPSATSILIPRGKRSRSVTLRATQDSLYETNETVVVDITRAL